MVFAGLKKKTERAGRVKIITAQSVPIFLFIWYMKECCSTIPEELVRKLKWFT